MIDGKAKRLKGRLVEEFDHEPSNANEDAAHSLQTPLGDYSGARQGSRFTGEHVVARCFGGGIGQPAEDSAVGGEELGPVLVEREVIEFEEVHPAIQGDGESGSLPEGEIVRANAALALWVPDLRGGPSQGEVTPTPSLHVSGRIRQSQSQIGGRGSRAQRRIWGRSSS